MLLSVGLTQPIGSGQASTFFDNLINYGEKTMSETHV